MPLSIVEEEDGRVAVSSPYHPNFPARARSLGGVWDAARRNGCSIPPIMIG